MIEVKKCDICKSTEAVHNCLDKLGAYCNDCHAYLRKVKVCHAYEHIKGCDFCGVLDSKLLHLRSGKFKNNYICRECLKNGVL